MSYFSLAHSAGEDASAVVNDCLAQFAQSEPGRGPGFVYVTPPLETMLEDIIARLQQTTGVADWTGTTGIGICAPAQEYYEQPAMVAMVADLDPQAYFIFADRDRDTPQPPALDAWCTSDALHVGVVHGDPMDQQMPALLNRMSERVPEAFFTGGLSSSSGRGRQVAGEVGSGGVSGVLFDQSVRIASSHTQGCSPIGEPHTITACKGNIVAQLDGRPALEVLIEEIGEVMARDLSKLAGYVFAGFPIAASDTGDYMVRNLVGIDEENQLVAVAERVHEGMNMMFCRRDGNTARSDMQRMLDSVAAQVNGQASGALYFSCLGRGRHQFGPHSDELKMIADTLGDIPLAGFFANGEIFHNRFYAYTGVLTVFY